MYLEKSTTIVRNLTHLGDALGNLTLLIVTVVNTQGILLIAHTCRHCQQMPAFQKHCTVSKAGIL